MPGSFDFADTFESDNLIALTKLNKGAGDGIDDPTIFHALGGAFHFANNAVSIAPIALQSGQIVHLDIDFGASNNINPLDTEIRVVDARGHELAVNDTAASTDTGSPTTADAKLNFTAAEAGLYYIVVTHKTNDYVDDTFTFNNGGTDTGLFQLDVSIDALAALGLGTNGIDNVSLTNSQRRYDARNGDDYVSASNFNTAINGGDGDDGLYGAAGRDILSGGNGDDSLYGNDNRDILLGGAGDDYMDGGAGNDDLFGGSSGDNLYGGNGGDMLVGEAGRDSLNGDAHNDTLTGGTGDDYLEGGAGDDRLQGGEGRDTANYYANMLGVKVSLSLTAPQNTVGAGTDTLSSIETVNGSNTGGDTLTGNGQSNTFYGNGGNDSLTGAGGTDNLYGYAGDDTIAGGAEGDYIYGYTEGDHLAGGAGSDYFGYNNAGESTVADPDRIADFSHAQYDRIALSSVYDGTLTFIGAANFSGAPGELRAIPIGGGNQAVLVNLNAGLAAEFKIVVAADAALIAGDFYL